MMLLTYSVYLSASLLITVYVGRTLYRNGRCFLINCLEGNVRAADAVNYLLLAGYYLVNVAFVVLMLTTRESVTTPMEVIDVLSTKVGIVCVTLGVMHLFNLFVLTTFRRAVLIGTHRCDE